MTKKVLPIFILTLVLTLFKPSSVFASVLFSDDFSDGVADGWVVTRNPCQGNWEVKDGMYGIKIIGGSCVTETMPDDASWNTASTNYIIDVDMKFVAGTDKNLAWRYTDPSSWYDLHFMSPSGIHMQRLPPMISGNYFASYPIPNGNTYHITVEVREGNFKLAIDSNYIIDFYFLPEDDRFPVGRVALQASAGGDPISEVWFDNLVVTSIDGEPEENTPVVLLPGLGGSWNSQALITGGQGGNWKKVPFVKVYDNLRSTFLDNAGHTENEDYFEFYYDWRKPLNELADELRDYLENTVLDGKLPETKVNLVGHSMGGMIARAYGQTYGEDKINKIVTSGSPHEGAIPAWKAWSGANAGERWSWKWIGLQLYLHIHKLKYSSPVTAVHGLTPGLADLLPIFDFAKDENDQVIDVTTMDSFNTYLEGLRNALSNDLRVILNTIAGINQETDEWIKLSERSLADRLLGKWPDGRPIEYITTLEGDSTVLQKSALISDVNQLLTENNHFELAQTESGIQSILDALEITDVSPATGSEGLPRNPSLLFWLHSPADIRVTAPDSSQAGQGVVMPMPNSIYSPEDELLLIYNALNGTYLVEVLGTDNGDYDLNIGQLTESGETWTTIEDSTSPGETDSYQINFETANPQENPLVDLSGQTQLNLSKYRLEKLKEYINDQSLGLLKKRQLVRYIDKLIRLINLALDNIDAGSYSRAYRYARAAMAGCYSLRMRIDRLAKSMTDETRTYMKNETNEIGQLLLDGFVVIFKQSGKTISQKRVERDLKKAENINNKAANQLESVSGEDHWLGSSFELAQSTLNQAQSVYAEENFVEAYAHALISRLLSLETLRLAR